MKIFIAGATGAIGRPLIAQLLAKGHDLVALTRSPEKAQALVEQGIEPAIANVFDAEKLWRSLLLWMQITASSVSPAHIQ